LEDSLTKEKRFDRILEQALLLYLESGEGQKNHLELTIRIVKNSSTEKLSKFFEVDLSELEAIETIGNRASFMINNSMRSKKVQKTVENTQFRIFLKK